MCSEIVKIANYVGFSDPIKKIYFTNNTPENLPFLMFLILQIHVLSAKNTNLL